MWALRVTRSTIAATSRGSGNTAPHSLKGRLGRDRDAGAFLAFGDDLEEQLGAAGVDLDVAEFVQAEQVEPPVAGDHAGQVAFVGGLDEFVDQAGSGDVADPAALFAGGQPRTHDWRPVRRSTRAIGARSLLHQRRSLRVTR